MLLLVSIDILLGSIEEELMSQQIQKPNQMNNAENSALHTQKKLPSSLVAVLLVIVGAVLFVGAYVLSFFVMTECFEQIPTVPAWIPILILSFDILWVVLTRFCPIRDRARVMSNLVVLSVSAGVLFTFLCFWALPV